MLSGMVILSLRISGWRRLVLQKRHKCEIRCVLDEGADIARKTGVTRTVRASWPLRRTRWRNNRYWKCTFSCAHCCRMIDEGLRPALLVATPVGFVNAAESKEKSEHFSALYHLRWDKRRNPGGGRNCQRTCGNPIQERDLEKFKYILNI